MDDFCVWLERILAFGESVQTECPSIPSRSTPQIESILRPAYQSLSLEVAGPAIPFQPDVAFWGATTLSIACWKLSSDGNELSLDLDREPRSAADHLSADVALRLLPMVYRRAKARGIDHPLLVDLDRLLRAWPLSGVLIDFEGEPTGSLDFFGHSGLQRLYAERLLIFGRVGWVPEDGVSREWAELTFAERGRLLPNKPMGVNDES